MKASDGHRRMLSLASNSAMNQACIAASIMMLLAAWTLPATAFANAAANHVTSTDQVWNPSGHCIEYDTNLPTVPFVSGDQFTVRYAGSTETAAKTVAAFIRANNVIGTYEQGLGISSILQPGQPAQFPIFVDSGLSSGSGFTAPLCGSAYNTWAGIVIGVGLDDEETDADIAHELFHAAQVSLVQTLTVAPNWWFEATATDAETWFAASADYPLNYDHEVVANPPLPMDTYSTGSGAHQYAAYLFVQWLLGTDSRPGAIGWKFLRKSILDLKSSAPDWDAGINQALSVLPAPASCESTVFACQVADFWGDETNAIDPLPKYGHPPGLPTTRLTVSHPAETVTITPAAQYGAKILAIKPSSGEQQVDLTIPKAPMGLAVQVNLGRGLVQPLLTGDDFDETFCANGHTEGSYPLPKSGDIRIAFITESAQAPLPITVKIVSSVTKCPVQFRIVPGLDIGQLHIGMTYTEATKAACVREHTAATKSQRLGGTVQEAQFVEGVHAPFPDEAKCTADLYRENNPGFNTNVVVYFFNGHLAWMQIGLSQRFVTTTGIVTFEAIPATPLNACYAAHPQATYECNSSVPGSTESQFPSAHCPAVTSEVKICVDPGPSGRLTFASAIYWKCPDRTVDVGGQEIGFCNMPSSGFYVTYLGVATTKGFTLFN